MVRLRYGVVQLVTVFPVPAVLAYEHMTSDAKPLRLQFFLKPDIVGTGFQKVLDGMSSAISAVAEGIRFMQGVNGWQHRWRGGSIDCKGWRRREQQQGDNEVFHGLIRGEPADYRSRCQGCQHA